MLTGSFGPTQTGGRRPTKAEKPPFCCAPFTCRVLKGPLRYSRQVWVTDITCIRTWQGWLCLAVVVDIFARKVVGWSMKSSLSKELALNALLMAVWRRKPTGRVDAAS